MIQWILKFYDKIFNKIPTITPTERNEKRIPRLGHERILPKYSYKLKIGIYHNRSSRYNGHSLYKAYCYKCNKITKQIATQNFFFLERDSLKCLECNRPPRGGVMSLRI